jgi:hypothetical protein
MSMKKKAKLFCIIAIVCFITVLLYEFFNDSSYIRDNINKIDRANNIDLISEGNKISYPFDEQMIDLVSYGGMIIDVENPIEELFSPYRNELIELNIKIVYKKDDSIIATADVFLENDKAEEYILYMNNVYWSTNSKLEDLLKLIP